MNHAVTIGDLVHYCVAFACVLSLLGPIAWWMYAFADMMSDAPVSGPGRRSFAFIHGVPVALFAAWWFG